MSDFALGQRVRFAEHIKRKYQDHTMRGHNGPNKVWTGEAYPGKRLDGGEGIIIGKRTLSDGEYYYGSMDEPGQYSPHRYFTAYLIAFDLHRKPVHVLPEHIKATA